MTDTWPGTPDTETGETWPGTPDAPHEEAAVLPDLAKSAGIGLAKGAASVPGFPGDLQALARRFSPGEYLWNMFSEAHPEAAQWLTEIAAANKAKYGHLMERGDIPGNVTLPSSADIQHAVEQGTGQEWYEPKTQWGKRAETVTSFIPQALATGGEGVVANVLKGAVAPGVASQAAGEGFEGTWFETPARILGALTGAGLAHGAQTAANAAKTAGAAHSAAGEAGQLVGNPDITGGAVSRVAKDIRNDELTPAAAQTRMDELGPEGMMLDAGRQLQGRAEAIATQPGAGQNRVLNAVENRTGTFGDATAQRIKDTLNRTMGQSPDIVATTKAVGDIVDKQAKPLYDAVMAAHPDVDVPAGILKRPAVRQAMGDAESIAKNYGEPLTAPVSRTTMNAAGVPVTQTVQQPKLDLRYWDNVKKAMDSRISGMLRTGGVQALDSAEKADLGGLIAARNALRDHLDTVTSGAYADARRVAATKPQLTEALEQGQAALNTKLLPEELKDLHDNMSIPQQAMLRMGMRREIERVIDVARNDGAAARRVLDTNQNREKIAEIFGQKAADEIDKRIAAETQFQQAKEKIANSSRTGVRSQLIKDTESSSVSAPPVANLMGYLAKGAGALHQSLADTGMERTRNAIGSLMTAPANQVPDLVRILSGYNQRAAANARPPITPLAKTLARVGTIRGVNYLAQQEDARRHGTAP
jgi:hypothetical protein